jgi:hypothetical protein
LCHCNVTVFGILLLETRKADGAAVVLVLTLLAKFDVDSMWYPKVGNNAVFFAVIVPAKTAHEWYCARRGESS